MVKNLPANAEDIRDAGSIPGLGRSSGEGNGNALQCLKDSVNYKLAPAMGAYPSTRIRSCALQLLTCNTP